MPPKGNGRWSWGPEGDDGMETQYDCGYAEYYHVDLQKCVPMKGPLDNLSPLDNVDRVKPINEEFENWEYNREVAELQEDEIDPEQEFRDIEEELLEIELATQGESFKGYVNYGICCQDWDREYELMLYVEEFGFRPHYTYDPRPE